MHEVVRRHWVIKVWCLASVSFFLNNNLLLLLLQVTVFLLCFGSPPSMNFVPL